MEPKANLGLVNVSVWLLLLTGLVQVQGQCPWPRDLLELQSSCTCSYNQAQELTLQCAQVDFPVLLTTLQTSTASKSQAIDMLYVHNSSIGELRDSFLKGLSINNLQLSRCRIRNVSPKAFQGQEGTLKSLNLQDNALTQVPVEALRPLHALALLDLAGNKIDTVEDDAFITLRLTTLKLSDNNVTLSPGAFKGLEQSLKNLNLKGNRLREVPEAVHHLEALAFLDLAQNQIRNISGGVFKHMISLTALNLERNSIQMLEPSTFLGVNQTLSSLSLLNNLISIYPSSALNTLANLRVLDIGFNMLTTLPSDAFRNIHSLTLLALDGNPLGTLPLAAFRHLNQTLRGLSLGGKFLHCNCELRWVAEWIRDYDLQVTSRERNPQFCGSPPEFRSKNFYHFEPEELQCSEEEEQFDERDQGIGSQLLFPVSSTTTTTTTMSTTPSTTETRTTPTTTSTTTMKTPEVVETSEEAVEDEPEELMTPSSTPRATVGNSVRGSVHMSTLGPRVPLTRPTTQAFTTRTMPSFQTPSTPLPSRSATNNARPAPVFSNNGNPSPAPLPFPSRNTPQQSRPRPSTDINSVRNSLIRGSSGSNARQDLNSAASSEFSQQSEREVIVKDAYRQDSSVVIHWDSDTSNILGFRVVYRLFGENNFQPGPPLDPSEREFKIKNVPAQEAIIVCVVSLEESNVTPETVPYNQCREIRIEAPASNHMDKIIIGASASICGTVIIAVAIFVCCNRRRMKKNEKKLLPTLIPNHALNGVNTINGANALMTGAPLASLGALGYGLGPKDWDQMSMYSGRSIPRPRVYQDQPGSVNGGFIPEDARSHISQYSIHKLASQNLHRSRSLADGQSQRSASAMSGRFGSTLSLHNAGLQNNGPMSFNMNMGVPNMGLGLSRQDLRASHRSLADYRLQAMDAAGGNATLLTNDAPGRLSRKPSRASQASRRSDYHRRQRSAAAIAAAEQQQMAAMTGEESSWETDRERQNPSSQSMHGMSAAVHSLRRQSFSHANLNGIHTPGGVPGASAMAGGLAATGLMSASTIASANNQSNGLLRGHLSRLSAAGSMRSVTTSNDTDNWTDHDMDIYMARNSIRQDLVRL